MTASLAGQLSLRFLHPESALGRGSARRLWLESRFHDSRPQPAARPAAPDPPSMDGGRSARAAGGCDFCSAPIGTRALLSDHLLLMPGRSNKGSLRPWGIIDRYVMRPFAGSYLSAFLLVVGLFLIIDMALNLDSFLAEDESGIKPSLLLVMQYYALKVPFLYLEMSPYVTLVAGMFTASKMTRFNEVVAALNAGVSIRRLFAPVLISAGLLALGMFGLREWVTQDIGLRLMHVQDQLEERRPVPIFERVRVFDQEGRAVNLERFYLADGEEGSARFEGLGCRYRGSEDSTVVTASAGQYLGDGLWSLEGGFRQIVGPERNRNIPLEILEDSRFEPGDVITAWKAAENPMALSFSESRALLERDTQNGQLRTLYYYHLTFPLAGLALLAVGLPFVLAQDRGKAAERVSKGFSLCVLFFGLEFICRTLGLQGQLSPLFAAWLPILGFGALGTVLYGSMRS